MGNSINSDDEGAEGSPPLLRGHLVLVYLQSRLAVEDTAVRDAARSTTSYMEENEPMMNKYTVVHYRGMR